MPLPLLVVAWGLIGLATLLSIRLLLAGARARSLPEILMASFFLGGGLVGYGVLLLRRTLGLALESEPGLRIVSEAGFTIPVLALTIFTWRVFRPTEAWASALAIGATGFVTGAFVLGTWIAPALGMGDRFATQPGTPFYWFSISVRSVCFGWACLEACLYYARARRRLELGLAEPLVVNRFLLWAVWSGAAVALLVFRVLEPLVADTLSARPMVPLWLVLGQMGAGIVCATAVWLTFAPPGFYRRMVTGRAAA